MMLPCRNTEWPQSWLHATEKLKRFCVFRRHRLCLVFVLVLNVCMFSLWPCHVRLSGLDREDCNSLLSSSSSSSQSSGCCPVQVIMNRPTRKHTAYPGLLEQGYNPSLLLQTPSQAAGTQAAARRPLSSIRRVGHPYIWLLLRRVRNPYRT